MRNNFFKKSIGICAAVLMIISAGGNTLTASAKHYHHKRISRRITKRQMTKYRYKRGHQAYISTQRRLRYDQKQLKKLKRSFKIHKHGRLRRHLNQDRRHLLNDVRRCNKYTRRLKMFAKAPKSYKKPRPRVHRKRNVRRHKAIASDTDNDDSDVDDTPAVIQASSASDQPSVDNSSDVQSQSTSIDTPSSATSATSESDSSSANNDDEPNYMNTNQASASSESNPQSASNSESYDMNTDSGIMAEVLNNEYSTENSMSNSSRQKWQKIASSEANPSTLSNAAWSYINATSSEFKQVDNPDTTKPNFAAALGHPYAIDQPGPTPSAQQLNDWYNEHSINDDTRNADAYYWYTRYNDGYHTIDDRNESNTDEIYNDEYLGKLIKLPDDISSFDGYEKLHHMYSSPIGGGGMSPQGASTQAAFDNNIDNDNIEGAADNLDQMGD